MLEQSIDEDQPFRQPKNGPSQCRVFCSSSSLPAALPTALLLALIAATVLLAVTAACSQVRILLGQNTSPFSDDLPPPP